MENQWETGAGTCLNPTFSNKLLTDSLSGKSKSITLKSLRSPIMVSNVFQNLLWVLFILESQMASQNVSRSVKMYIHCFRALFSIFHLSNVSVLIGPWVITKLQAKERKTSSHSKTKTFKFTIFVSVIGDREFERNLVSVEFSPYTVFWQSAGSDHFAFKISIYCISELDFIKNFNLILLFLSLILSISKLRSTAKLLLEIIFLRQLIL